MKFAELWKFWFPWYGICYGGTNHFKLAHDLTFPCSWRIYLINFFNDLIRKILSFKKFRKLETFLNMCRIEGNHWDLLNLKNCSVFLNQDICCRVIVNWEYLQEKFIWAITLYRKFEIFLFIVSSLPYHFIC